MGGEGSGRKPDVIKMAQEQFQNNSVQFNEVPLIMPNYSGIQTAALKSSAPLGGGTPGGATTQVQFNDNGTFSGSSNLTYSGSIGVLGIGGAIQNWAPIELYNNGYAAMFYKNTGTDGREWILGDAPGIPNGNFGLLDNTAGVQRMLISPTGQMVLGSHTTPANSGSTGYFLEVGSTAGGVITLRDTSSTVTANDEIGKIQFYIKDSSTTTNFIVADIAAQATNTVTTDINPGRLIFRTTGTGVAATPTERMRINESGFIGIGNIPNPAKALEVSGSIFISGGSSGVFGMGLSGGIAANVTTGDLVGKTMNFSGGILVGYS